MIDALKEIGMEDLHWHVGHVLRRLRLAHGKESQRQTAKSCGISAGAYQRLEERGEVTLTALERVATHFGTTVAALHTYAGLLNDAGNPSTRSGTHG